MSCGCGGSRPPTPQPGSHRIPVVVYRYEGTTSLTVVGRATNQRYHFPKTGAEVAVDWRDYPSVAQVPKLREVRRG